MCPETLARSGSKCIVVVGFQATVSVELYRGEVAEEQGSEWAAATKSDATPQLAVALSLDRSAQCLAVGDRVSRATSLLLGSGERGIARHGTDSVPGDQLDMRRSPRSATRWCRTRM